MIRALANMVRDVMTQRQRDANRLDYLRGFDYAAGALLRGADPEGLDRRMSWEPTTPFDEGLTDAVREFWRLQRGAMQ